MAGVEGVVFVFFAGMCGWAKENEVCSGAQSGAGFVGRRWYQVLILVLNTSIHGGVAAPLLCASFLGRLFMCRTSDLCALIAASAKATMGIE